MQTNTEILHLSHLPIVPSIFTRLAYTLEGFILEEL